MNYSTVRIFDCPVYSLVDRQKKNKLESKSKRCVCIGFTKGVMGFKLWDPEIRSAFISRDVVFYEDSMLQAKSKTEDKVQSRASYSSANSEREEFELSNDSNKHVGQIKTPEFRMETSKKLLRSNMCNLNR